MINNNVHHLAAFCGCLGSGKTEIAINFALCLRQSEIKPVHLVDIDVVNPYFRSRVMREHLAGKGINVICPAGELAGADIPALPPDILGVIENPGVYGVFDVGGDDVGATVLGRFKPYLEEGSYNLFFVVNINRPFTRDEDGITRYITAIEKASRLRVTALVNNTNLGHQTDVETVKRGQKVISRVAEKKGIPVAFAASIENLAPLLQDELPVPVLPLQLHMQPPWSEHGILDANDFFKFSSKRFFNN